MQVHTGTENLPIFPAAVITIGTFDGVHSGHKKIVQAVIEKAKDIKGTSILITFDPHPRKIIQPLAPLGLINTLQEKTQLLGDTGLDVLVIVPFTASFAEQPAEDYITRFLVQHFAPHTIIIGYDHHFGRARSGNIELLKRLSEKYNYEVTEIPKHEIDAIDISSTQIRKALQRSDIATANKLLGYTFYFSGIVVQGDKIGRTLGYPTANLQLLNNDKIHVGEGVFAVTVIHQHKKYKGILSIGKRPTLNDVVERIEVFIFEFNQSIYNELLTVFVHGFIRSQEKFKNLDALKIQMDKDAAEAQKILEPIKFESA